MLRKTGLKIIGDLPWGAHYCQFYKTKEDLLDILVPYFREGLKDNEFCMWVTSEVLSVKEAREALSKEVSDLDRRIKIGQIEILHYTEWYTKTGSFNADSVLKGWAEKEEMALKRGFEGLRLSGDTFWVDKSIWKSFADYEEVVNNVLGRHKIIALCTYSLDKCAYTEIMDVARNHQFSLIRRERIWEKVESTGWSTVFGGGTKMWYGKM